MGSPRTTNENKMRVYQQHENEDDSASLLYKVPHVNEKHDSAPTDVRKLFQRSISLPKLLRKLSFTKRVASKKANNNDNGAQATEENDNDSDNENEMESSNHEQENSDKSDKSNKTKNYSKRRSKSKSSSPRTIQKQDSSDDELRFNSAKDIVASALIALGKQSEKTYTSLSKKRNRRKRDDERNKTKNNKTDIDQHDVNNDNDDDATSVTQDFSHDDSSNSSHLSPLPPFQKYFDDDDDDDVESIKSDTEHFEDNQDDDDDSSTSSGSVITEDGPLSFDGDDDGDYFNIDSDDDDDLLADIPPGSPKEKRPDTTKQGRKVTFRPSVTCYTNKRKLSEQDIRNGWWSKAHVNKRAIDAAHAVQTYMTEQPESVENLLMVFDLCEQACTMNELESGPAKLALVSLRNVRGLEMSICPELKELIQDYREEMMEYYYDGIPESASTETQGKLLAKKSRELSKPFKRMARVMAQADEYLVKLG